MKEKIKKNKKLICHILLTFFVFSISIAIDHSFRSIKISKDILSTLAQIQVSLVALTVTMESIATTFINDEIFGVKLRAVMKIRKNTYSLLSMIFILLILSSVSIFALISDLFFLGLSTVVLTIYYSLKFSFQDLPLCFRCDKAIIKVLKENKNNLNVINLENQEIYNELLTNYAIKKRIDYVYKKITDEREVETIDYLFGLLCKKLDGFPNYDDFTNKMELEKYVDSLLDNIMLLFNEESKIFEDYDDANKMALNYAKILYLIHKKKDLLSETTIDKFKRVFIMLFNFLLFDVSKKTKLKIDIAFKTYYQLLIWSLKNGEIWAVDLLRERYSSWSFIFTKHKMSNVLFSNISMVLFYYYAYETNIEESFKLEIKKIIDENKRKGNTFYHSWKYLFNEHLQNFNLAYVDLMNYFDIDKFEYMIANQTKSCIFSKFSVADWWVKCFISSDNANINSLSFLDEDFPHKEILANKLDNLFELNTKNIVLTDDIRKFYDIYNINEVSFKMLEHREEVRKKLFNFKNEFKKTEIMKETNNNLSTSLAKLKDKLFNGTFNYFESLVKNKKEVDLSNIVSRGFYIMAEMFDLEDTAKMYLDYIKQEYQQDFKKVFDKSFNSKYIGFDDKEINIILKRLLDKNPSTTSERIMWLTDSYVGIDKKIKKDLLDLDKNIKYDNSYPLVKRYTYFNDKAISFDYKIDIFELMPLSEDEVLKELENYQSDAGTYYYQGIQFNYLELKELIKNKYFKIKIFIKYKINYDKEEMFVFDPFNDK